MEEYEGERYWPVDRYETLRGWIGPDHLDRPSLIGAHGVYIQQLQEFHEALNIAIEYVRDDLDYMNGQVQPRSHEEMVLAERELRAAVAKVVVAMDLIHQCQETIVHYFST